MNLRLETIPPAPPSRFENWLKPPRRCLAAHGYWKWLRSDECKAKTFTYKEMINIVRIYTMHEKRYERQFQLLYQDHLAGLTEEELCAKYLVKARKVQWVIKTRGRDLPEEVIEVTEEFIKARLSRMTRDADDAIVDLKKQLTDTELKEWLDEEKIVTSGGKFDGETKTRKSASVKARRELHSAILKTHLALFDGIGQLVPKANINIQFGKDLASLPQETLEKLIEQEKKQLKPNATVQAESASS